MKVVSFLQTLFIPSCMGKRKGMNVFISFAILLVASLVLALPMINYFSKDRYEIMDEYLNFNIFKYCVNEDDTIGAFTEEEKAQYNLVYFKDIKALGIQADKNGIACSESCENGKEYVVKSYVPIKDDEGTITGYNTYYIHIVYDYYDANNDETATYSIENTFCKYSRESDNTFHHCLIAFYDDGIIYSNSDEYSSATNLEYNRKTNIDFNEANDMTYVSHALTDILYKVYIYKATKQTFITAFLFPVIIAILISMIIKGAAAPFNGWKEYLAIAAIATITPIIACTIASMISLKWCSYAFSYYPFIFILYYIVIIYINIRRARFKKDELRELKNNFSEGK